MGIVLVMLIVPDHLQLERTCHADVTLGMCSDVIGSILAGSGPVFLTNLYFGLSWHAWPVSSSFPLGGKP